MFCNIINRLSINHLISYAFHRVCTCRSVCLFTPQLNIVQLFKVVSFASIFGIATDIYATDSALAQLPHGPDQHKCVSVCEDLFVLCVRACDVYVYGCEFVHILCVSLGYLLVYLYICLSKCPLWRAFALCALSRFISVFSKHSISFSSFFFFIFLLETAPSVARTVHCLPHALVVVYTQRGIHTISPCLCLGL